MEEDENGNGRQNAPVLNQFGMTTIFSQRQNQRRMQWYDDI
jgi:hypothetical protein